MLDHILPFLQFHFCPSYLMYFSVHKTNAKPNWGTDLSFFFLLRQDVRDFTIQALNLLEPGLNDLCRNNAMADFILSRAVFNCGFEYFSISFAN